MKLTLEDKLKIIELREKGYGFGTIAKQFKVRKSTIERIWHRYEKHGTDGIIHPPKNRKYSPELKLEIIIIQVLLFLVIKNMLLIITQ